MNDTRHDGTGPGEAVNARRFATRTTLAMMAAASLTAAVGVAAGVAAAGAAPDPEDHRTPTSSQPVIAEPQVIDETDVVDPPDLMAGLPGLDAVFGSDDAGWADYCPPCGMG